VGTVTDHSTKQVSDSTRDNVLLLLMTLQHIHNMLVIFFHIYRSSFITHVK